jgi:hypothetical protein
MRRLRLSATGNRVTWDLQVPSRDGMLLAGGDCPMRGRKSRSEWLLPSFPVSCGKPRRGSSLRGSTPEIGIHPTGCASPQGSALKMRRSCLPTPIGRMLRRGSAVAGAAAGTGGKSRGKQPESAKRPCDHLASYRYLLTRGRYRKYLGQAGRSSLSTWGVPALLELGCSAL